jgi:hypothetical protein
VQTARQLFQAMLAVVHRHHHRNRHNLFLLRSLLKIIAIFG